MLVTNDAAVLNAWSGATPGKPEAQRQVRLEPLQRIQTSTDTAEKASSARA